MAESIRKITAILPRLPEHLSTPLFAGTTSRHFEAGQALFLAGEPGNGCYRLKRGLLKVVIISPEGDQRILAILGPGEIAGELSVIDGEPRSASVFAVTDCELSFISRLGFEKFAQQHPDIYRYLVNVLASRLRETDEAVAATSFLTVKARLARALLELAEYLGEDAHTGRVLIRHKFSQRDLAAMAGVARTIVQRINQKLVAKGQILMATRRMKMKLDYGDYYILDLSGNVMDLDIDPEELARKLGVLNEGEKVKRRSRKTRLKKEARPLQRPAHKAVTQTAPDAAPQPTPVTQTAPAPAAAATLVEAMGCDLDEYIGMVRKESSFSARLPAVERGRTFRTLARFFIVALIGVGATFAWQYHGDEAKEMVKTLAASLGGLSSLSTAQDAAAEPTPVIQTAPVPARAEISPELVQQFEDMVALCQQIQMAHNAAQNRHAAEWFVSHCVLGIR
jgi:CRP/FNR family transcriptional regulator, cyclic AMP receptor protein